MHRLLSAAALLAAAAIATPVAAEDWYGRVDVGLGFGGGLETPREINIAPPFGGDGALDGGWSASAGIGRSFASGVRIEGELAYRTADIESSATIAPGAEASATSLFANAIYDFNREGRFRPYLGVGIGAAQIDAAAFNNAILPSDLVGFDDTDTKLAYQALAGLGVGLSDGLTLDLGYRYLAARDLEFSGRGALGVSRKFAADFDQHSVSAGVRWRLAG